MQRQGGQQLEDKAFLWSTEQKLGCICRGWVSQGPCIPSHHFLGRFQAVGMGSSRGKQSKKSHTVWTYFQKAQNDSQHPP